MKNQCQSFDVLKDSIIKLHKKRVKEVRDERGGRDKKHAKTIKDIQILASLGSFCKNLTLPNVLVVFQSLETIENPYFQKIHSLIQKVHFALVKITHTN